MDGNAITNSNNDTDSDNPALRRPVWSISADRSPLSSPPSPPPSSFSPSLVPSNMLSATHGQDEDELERSSPASPSPQDRKLDKGKGKAVVQNLSDSPLTPVLNKPLGVVISGAKSSRKVSCDLCHHKKVRCDQVKPTCGSCTRRRMPCHYSDLEERPTPPQSRQPSIPISGFSQRNGTVTIISATDPGQRVVIPIPQTAPFKLGHRPSASRSAPSIAGMKEGASLGVDMTNNNGKATAQGNAAAALSSARRKRDERRERILEGFGSSDNEGDNLNGQQTQQPNRHKLVVDCGESSFKAEKCANGVGNYVRENGGAITAGTRGDRNGALEGHTVDVDPGKRVAEELLELATGPPHKKHRHAPLMSITARPLPSDPKPPTAVCGPSVQARPVTAIAKYPPVPLRLDPYVTPVRALIAQLPNSEAQTLLFRTFFNDQFLPEGITLMQGQIMSHWNILLQRRANGGYDGDAKILAIGMACFACAIRVLPQEAVEMITAMDQTLPKSLGRIMAPSVNAGDSTPLDQRFFEMAQLAYQISSTYDTPSLQTIVLLIILHRYSALSPIKLEKNTKYIALAVRAIYDMELHREMGVNSVSLVEMEQTRRMVWTVYIADKQTSLENERPYLMVDIHQGVHYPSPIPDQIIQNLRPPLAALPPFDPELQPTPNTLQFFLAHFSNQQINVLDHIVAHGTSEIPEDLVLAFEIFVKDFVTVLPPYFRLPPDTDNGWDATCAWLPAHRLRLHNTILSYWFKVSRNLLHARLSPEAPLHVGEGVLRVYAVALRVQRSIRISSQSKSSRLFNPQMAFEANMVICLLMVAHKRRRIEEGKLFPDSEWRQMRETVRDGIEVLSGWRGGVNHHEGYAMAAETLVRQLLVMVGNPEMRCEEGMRHSPEGSPVNAPSNNGAEDDSTVKQHNGDAVPKKRESLTTVYHRWLQSLKDEGLPFDQLLRVPAWENKWERVLHTIPL